MYQKKKLAAELQGNLWAGQPKVSDTILIKSSGMGYRFIAMFAKLWAGHGPVFLNWNQRRCYPEKKTKMLSD